MTSTLEIMSAKHDDQLSLAHLSLIDMERVQKSIEFLCGTDDKYLKAALFRDAIISYAKPFSNNRYSNKTTGLRIADSHIPKGLMSAHKELLALRDELVAHTDMTIQKPKIDKYQDDMGHNFSLSASGYETIHKDHLIEPLLTLARAVHSSLIRGRSGQTKNDF